MLPRHGRSGCSSQTQPVLSQFKYAMTPDRGWSNLETFRASSLYGLPALMCSSHSQYNPAAPTTAAARAIQPFNVAVMK
jgi:hypothetical protein